jgi:hypothetical protein
MASRYDGKKFMNAYLIVILKILATLEIFSLGVEER